MIPEQKALLTDMTEVLNEVISEHTAMVSFFESLESEDLPRLNGILTDDKMQLLIKALELVVP